MTFDAPAQGAPPMEADSADEDFASSVENEEAQEVTGVQSTFNVQVDLTENENGDEHSVDQVKLDQARMRIDHVDPHKC